MRTYCKMIIQGFLVCLLLMATGCASKTATVPVGPLDEPVHLSASGEKLLARGDATGAKDFFNRALAMDAGYVPAIVGLSQVEAKSGGQESAISLGKKALAGARNEEEKLLARTNLMDLYLTLKPENWLEDMEAHWKRTIEETSRPERATLLMGKGYQDSDAILKATVCYRQVIGWNGKHVAEADELLQKLYKQLQAEPGTVTGKKVAALNSLTRGDLAALLIEDLKLAEYLDAKKVKKYNARFQTPDSFAKGSDEEVVPSDVAGHPYEVDINDILHYGIRGLEVLPDGMFHPAETLTRANFAMVMEDVLVRIKNEPLLQKAFIGNDSPFPDVANDHYGFNAIVVSTTRNILAADIDGAFRPSDPVTGAEALLAIRRLKEEIKGHQVTY